jgi:hypothetical protein
MRTLAGRDLHKRWSMFLKLTTGLEDWDFCIVLPKKELLSTRMPGEPGVDKKITKLMGFTKKRHEFCKLSLDNV